MAIEHISEKPWSDYTSADYTIEQWHRACLIHQHVGSPTSKNQCKLPVKTPSGVVNKNGVHAAAAVLAGARGGVHASSTEKAAAKAAIRRLYSQMNEDPPPSMKQSNVVSHFGIKGMHWGIRNERRALKADMKWQANIYSVRGAVAVHNNVADKMNNGGLARLNAKYKGKRPLDPVTGEPNGKIGKQYLNEYHKMNEDFTRQAVAEVHGTSPSGGYKAHLDTSNRRQWKVKISKTNVGHAAEDIPELIMNVDHNEFGQITLTAMIKEAEPMQQFNVSDFLSHHGVKGMHWGVHNVRAPRTRKESKARAKRQRASQARRTLSDKDLDAFVKRLKSEKQLKELVNQDLRPGRSKAVKILDNAGTKVVGNVAAGAATLAVGAFVGRYFAKKGTPAASSKGKQVAEVLMRGGLKKK